MTDLGMSHPPEEAIRGRLLATRLAGQLGIRQPELAVVYYTALLRYLGCHRSAHEEAAAFADDDLEIRQAGVVTDFTTRATSSPSLSPGSLKESLRHSRSG